MKHAFPKAPNRLLTLAALGSLVGGAALLGGCYTKVIRDDSPEARFERSMNLDGVERAGNAQIPGANHPDDQQPH